MCGTDNRWTKRLTVATKKLWEKPRRQRIRWGDEIVGAFPGARWSTLTSDTEKKAFSCSGLVMAVAMDSDDKPFIILLRAGTCMHISYYSDEGLPCGSIMRGQRREWDTTMALSTEKESTGSPDRCHVRHCTLSPKVLYRENLALQDMPSCEHLLCQSFKHLWK